MCCNVGGIDRIARILIGLTLLLLVVNDQIGWWGWLGILPFATGVLGCCPAYLPFGWRTSPPAPKPQT